MARLVIQSEGFDNQILELNLGVNRVGRSSGNHFLIEHPTVSARHCELILRDTEVLVNDCGSTNGTFLDGRPIKRAKLEAGQHLRLGDVELLVETTAVNVAIPKFDIAKPAPPVVLSDGGLLCPRHPKARATHQCTHCREVLCDECVHHLRRRGGKVHKLCPLCSHRCEPLGGEKAQKRSLWKLFNRTVKLPFARGRKHHP